MEEKITDLCEIEVELYLDYYNGEYGFSEFNQKLDSNQNKIINLVYDLLEEGFDEEKIISEIKSLGAYYKKTPEFFGKDNDTSMYPSGYFETIKIRNILSMRNVGIHYRLLKDFLKQGNILKLNYL